MRSVFGCLSGMSPVLLVALICCVLLDVALAVLLREVFRNRIAVGRVERHVRRTARTFGAAVRGRYRRGFGGHVSLLALNQPRSAHVSSRRECPAVTPSLYFVWPPAA